MMLNLLHECFQPGYPPDYLLARIRGRIEVHVLLESGFSWGRSTFQADDTAIWVAEADERRWIYRQMDVTLRKVLAPLLFYFEINTMIVCLRSLETGQPDMMAGSLERSLLAEEVKEILRTLIPPGKIVARMERFLDNAALGLDGLALAYEKEGLKGCEERIRKRFLEQAPDICGHPEVINFFRKIIDLKNILTMAKCVRWKKQELPDLISGGHIRLRKKKLSPSEAGLKKMVSRFKGGLQVTAAELHPVRLEELLNETIAKTMTRRLRSTSPVGCCVGYIWCCFAASRKKSVAYHAARFAENFSGAGEFV